MSLTAPALNRFRARVDGVLEAFFPCELRIAGVSVPAAGPGGRARDEYMEGGKSTDYRFAFRVAKAALAICPRIGSGVEWMQPGGPELAMEVLEIAIRPHDSHWSIVCRHRRE